MAGGRGREARPILVAWVVGGERGEVREQEEVEVHLLVCLYGSGMVGARWSTASREVAAEGNGDGEAPVKN